MAEVEVGTTLIFENEQVKVWEFTLAPGEEIYHEVLVELKAPQ